MRFIFLTSTTRNSKQVEEGNCYSKTTSILTVKYFGKKGKKRHT